VGALTMRPFRRPPQQEVDAELAFHLEERGWVAAEWGVSENNRKAKFYALTAQGRRALTQEAASWTRYAHAVFAALDAGRAPQPV